MTLPVDIRGGRYRSSRSTREQHSPRDDPVLPFIFSYGNHILKSGRASARRVEKAECTPASNAGDFGNKPNIKWDDEGNLHVARAKPNFLVRDHAIVVNSPSTIIIEEDRIPTR